MEGTGRSWSTFRVGWPAKDAIGVGAERKNFPVHHVTTSSIEDVP
jgi:hypothetical protein